MSTWIFQGNPDRFDLDGYLASTSVVLWTVNQKHLALQMKEGDRVFFWRAKGKGKRAAGVVGSGMIVELPTMRPDDVEARRFWVDQHEADIERSRARIRITAVAKGDREVVKRDWLVTEPQLRDLRIFKLANETNYLVSPEQARRLEVLWENTGREWSEAESIAGLWAYARTYGGEVSMLPGSPVVEIAERIGRAVTGVYNKVMNFRALDPRDPREGLSGGGKTDAAVWASFYDKEVKQLDFARLGLEYQRLWGAIGQASMGEGVDEPSVPGEAGAARLSQGGQGYEDDPQVRAAVEQRAMELAHAFYEAQHYDIEITATTHPFDLRCIKDGTEVRVEAKGSRGNGSTLELTVGEVESARASGWRTDLYLVTGIEIRRVADQVVGVGGHERRIEGWRPANQDLKATRFRYIVPEPR